MPTPILPTRLSKVNTATTYTFTAYDQNAIVTTNNAGAQTLTIPESTTINYPIGSTITVIQLGAGVPTVVKTGSDTIVGTVAGAGVGDQLTLTKISATGWSSALAT